jgi:hypothetical protein
MLLLTLCLLPQNATGRNTASSKGERHITGSFLTARLFVLFLDWLCSIALLRRVALVAVSVLCVQAPLLREQLLSLLCLALFTLQLLLRPYARAAVNAQESVALCALVAVSVLQGHGGGSDGAGGDADGRMPLGTAIASVLLVLLVVLWIARPIVLSKLGLGCGGGVLARCCCDGKGKRAAGGADDDAASGFVDSSDLGDRKSAQPDIDLLALNSSGL